MRRLGYELALGRISTERAVEVFLQRRRRLHAEISASECNTYVEANPFLLFWLPVVRKAYAGYRIVHLVRDGRDWVRSVIGRPALVLPDNLLPFLRLLPDQVVERTDQMPECIACFIRDAWNPRAVDFPLDPFAEQWREMSRFEKLAWVWRKKEEYVHAAIGEDDNAITIRFEDIFVTEGESPGLERLLSWFEIGDDGGCTPGALAEVTRQRVNATPRHTYPHWREWDDEIRRTFDSVAGCWLSFYGYNW